MALVENNSQPNLDEDHVRGGVTGHNVRYVLATSLGLLVLALIVVAPNI